MSFFLCVLFFMHVREHTNKRVCVVNVCACVRLCVLRVFVFT